MKCRDYNLGMVMMKSGQVFRLPIMFYYGACLTGDPTAFVLVNGSMVWIHPGESVEWMEN